MDVSKALLYENGGSHANYENTFVAPDRLFFSQFNLFLSNLELETNQTKQKENIYLLK